MATTFRTEDEAVAADHAVFQFTGPHFHKEHPKGADGEFTLEEVVKTDRWGNQYKDFATIEVPCDGCWL